MVTVGSLDHVTSRSGGCVRGRVGGIEDQRGGKLKSERFGGGGKYLRRTRGERGGVL